MPLHVDTHTTMKTMLAFAMMFTYNKPALAKLV
jgi:hypothetical protein